MILFKKQSALTQNFFFSQSYETFMFHKHKISSDNTSSFKAANDIVKHAQN